MRKSSINGAMASSSQTKVLRSHHIRTVHSKKLVPSPSFFITIVVGTGTSTMVTMFTIIPSGKRLQFAVENHHFE